MPRTRWYQVLTLVVATLVVTTIACIALATAAEQTVTVYKTPT
jgi:hypothetical protein